MSYMDGLNFINSFDAANLNTFNNNMAAAQANSNAMILNPPVVYQSPVAFGDYSYGTVGGYPSFQEANPGYVYPGYGPRPGVETQYAPEPAFSPQGPVPQAAAPVAAAPQIIDPRTLPNYVEGGYYDDYGNLLGVYGPYGGNAAYGGGAPDVGYGAVTGGYNSGAGLSPLNPSTGAGAGIYNDAGQYLGGDFSGGGSDPYAGTIYAGGGGGSPDFGGSLATPYDQYGSRWTPDGSGGIGSDATAAPPDYNNPWTGYNSGGFDPFQSYYPGQRNVGDGYGGGAGSAGDWGQSFSPGYSPRSGGNGPSVFDWGTSPTPYFNEFLVPDFQLPDFQWRGGQQSSEAGTPYGQGGIGADALHDVFNWQLAQSSPYAEASSPPPMGGMPNIGYNPGMENYFANPDMRQPQFNAYEAMLQQLLGEIDQGTANQNLDPNWSGPGAEQDGGRSFYEGDNLNQGDRSMGFDAGAGGDASFADRFDAAPAITPGLQPQAGDFNFPMGITAGVDPSPNLPGTFTAPPSQEQLAPETGLDFSVPDINEDAVRSQLLNSMNQAPPPDETSMADYQSPANNYSTFQQGATNPWTNSIPPSRYDPNMMNAIYRIAGERGFDPAALAAVIQMETQDNPRSLWNTEAKTKSYHGLTQMGPKSFAEAPDGMLNGLTWDQYKQATPEQQIATYGAWLDSYAKNSPDNAASLVTGGIGSLPPEMQAAIMMGTQFGPNSTRWVKALGEGNMSMPTTPYDQADALKPYSIEAMRDAMAKQMMEWRR